MSKNYIEIKYSYKCVPTVLAFTQSKKRIKCIMGPFGSGKSSGCVMHLLRTAKEQAPAPDGVRYTRYAIVRNTTRQLKDTTKKTLDYWISSIAHWKESEMKYIFNFKLEDGTTVNSEWLLRALDRPDQVRDLLSMELTGAWINEGREIDESVFNALDGRIDRYPPKNLGGATYPYIIIDTNPPDDENWLYKYFEEKRLNDPKVAEKAEIFKQPSGLSPYAENLENLPDGYYENLAIGKDPDYIRVYIHGEYGYIREGKPVFPNFAHSIHVAKEPLIPIRGIPLTIGMDFGLFPACVISQVIPDGRLYVYDELVSVEATDLESFIKDRLIPLLQDRKYAGLSFVVIGDPAGQSRSQLDNRTCFTVLRSHGIQAYPAYTNSLVTRIQAVNNYLTRMVKGKPAFQVDASCKMLIQALMGKYCFRKLRVAGERYSEYPDKNSIFSHVSDALMYACLGYTPKQVYAISDMEEFSSKYNTSIELGSPSSRIRRGGWF